MLSCVQQSDRRRLVGKNTQEQTQVVTRQGFHEADILICELQIFRTYIKDMWFSG